ncbi:N-acetylmuramoyl-L-alanine amidase family protein [Tomitella biformata]|uniref:N-acetylmuramoyl-L-alanine amidase family protein n=1 Tax=Tomitella biformata TaxID=630403 RepID=UPI0004633467|nr:N-acetylmuramoyl-L-alanine amidase [Tomitella biformata]
MRHSGIKAVLCVSAVTAALLAPIASAGAAPAEGPTGTELAGKTVFLDPGHQGSAEGHSLSKQVPNGYGGMKDCGTTGMETVNGVAEHEINWNVATIVKGVLESLGAEVKMSRADDTGWGGCIDERAAAANASGADLAVSIHADSTSTTGADAARSGFHLIVPTLPLPNAAAQAAQSEGGRTASKLMVDSYKEQGFSPANYGGVVDAFSVRSDIAGPALTTIPLVFIEMGNGSNSADAAKLEGTDGQYEHATAIARGIVSYLFSDGYPEGEPATHETPASPETPAATSPEVTIKMNDGTVSTPAPTTPATAAITKPEAAVGVFDRMDEVFALFEKITAAGGIGALLNLVNDGDIGTFSDLTTDAVSLLGPLLSKVLPK